MPATFLADGLEVVWQSQLCGSFLVHTVETIFRRATNRASIPQHPNPSIPQTPSVFCQLGVPHILFPTVFPAESPALNGSYSQYGLMMGVSS